MLMKTKFLVPAAAAIAVAAFVATPFIGVADETAPAADTAKETDALVPAAESAKTPEGVEISAAATAVPAKSTQLTAEERELFLQGLGWLIGQQSGLIQDLRISEEDVPAVVDGFRLALLGQGKDLPEKIITRNKEYSAFIQDLLAKAAEKKLAENKAAAEKNKKLGADYVAQIKAEGGYTELPSGVLIKIIEAGDPAKKAQKTDTVAVRYTGTLVDGTIFDSSSRDEKTGEPFAFEPGKGETVELPLPALIPAWSDTIPMLGIGGRCSVVAPAEAAYGDEGAGSVIPPGATIIFDVELVGIVPPEKADAAKDNADAKIAVPVDEEEAEAEEADAAENEAEEADAAEAEAEEADETDAEAKK